MKSSSDHSLKELITMQRIKGADHKQQFSDSPFSLQSTGEVSAEISLWNAPHHLRTGVAAMHAESQEQKPIITRYFY